MATDKTLALRAIKPILRPAGVPAPNPQRRAARAFAQAANISEHRAKKILRKQSRGRYDDDAA